MGKRALLLLTLVGAMLLAVSGVVLAQGSTTDKKAPVEKEDQDTIQGQYIVVLKDNVGKAKDVADKHANKDKFAAKHVYEHALKGYSAKLSDAQLAEVQSEPEVEFISRDHEVQAFAQKQTDSKLSSSSKEGASAQSFVPITSGDSAPTGVKRISAATGTDAAQASDVNVAVIDTGIDLTHPDLNAQSGKNCISSGSAAQDDNGHGTHVSGTIAAKNNGSGVLGVAPGTKLYGAKVLNAQGSGTWSQVICGIDWVTANANALNIKVASMSLGGSGLDDGNCGGTNSDALHKAICNSTSSGVTYSVAAGNSGADLKSFVPAAYDEALTVTAMSDSDGAPGGTGGAPTCRSGETDDSYATFSNYAGNSTDQNHTIAGPGVCIKSTWLNGGYNTISGTSMATPHLSGTVALCIGSGTTAGPCAGKTPAQIIQQLTSDAQAYSNGTNGYGFTGDPLHSPVSGTSFGYLTYANGYASGGTTPSSGPETTIDSGPSGTLNSTSATFTFSSSDPSATFECRIDGTSWEPNCTSPKDYTNLNLADGSHTFEVRATNSSGTDPTPASRTWTIDTTAPTVVVNSNSPKPSDGQTGVRRNTSVSAQFSEEMAANTVSTSTVTLVKDGDPNATPITATVSYDPTTKTVTLKPSSRLTGNTWYKATITGAKDKAGNPLASNQPDGTYAWRFQTGNK